jgi:hypothetical protein
MKEQRTHHEGCPTYAQLLPLIANLGAVIRLLSEVLCT